jgi:hypothetical protein
MADLQRTAMSADLRSEGASMRRTVLSLFVAATICLVVPQARAAGTHKGPTPDGTLELKEGSVAAGVGYSWGGGTLTFHGKKYPVSVTGLSVGSVGASSVTARGSVYNLKKLEDFSGNYTAAKAGATVGGGGAVATMQNQNGVKINLSSTSRGLKLTLAAEGVSLKLK